MSSPGATNQTVTCSGTVEAPATTALPYNETFDADLGDCYTYSVSGDSKEWVWDAAGTEHIIRTGSCGALREDISVGDLVIVTGSVRGEGTTPYYVPDNFSTVSDIKVASALVKAAEKAGIKYHLGTVWTTDALLRETRERVEKMRELKVKAVDMVSASLLTVAQLFSFKSDKNLTIAAVCIIDKPYNNYVFIRLNICLYNYAFSQSKIENAQRMRD